jgi:hypothetical protein
LIGAVAVACCTAAYFGYKTITKQEVKAAALKRPLEYQTAFPSIWKGSL